MNRSNAVRQHLTAWAFVLGLWLLLVLTFSGQIVLTQKNIGWLQALTRSFHEWYPWALLSPAIVWLATRFPIERGKLSVSVPVHLLACALALVLCNWLSPPPPELRPPLRTRPQPPFPDDQNPPSLFPGAPPEDLPFPGREPRFAGEQQQPTFIRLLVLRARANIPIYFVLVSVVHALTYYRRSEERERNALELEARLADARLQALRSQLHPHFLFNTLNAISTLVHKDAAAADEMITNLSELLRATLDTTEQEISLRRELDFLSRYLEIQQVRFTDRLRVEKEIDAMALDGLVPTLILQPIAENAIRHGIEPQSGTGHVQIRAARDGNILRLSVRDTGSGPKHNAKERPGIGLANTRDRLQALYGNRARLTLNSGAEGGFTVELEIPFHEHSLSQKAQEESTADQ